VPYSTVVALGERAAELTGTESIGLHLAQVPHDPNDLDAGLLMVMAAATVRRAFELVVRLQRYWGDGQRFALVPTEGGARVRYVYPLSTELTSARRQSDECALAECVAGIRHMTGTDARPRLVRFAHPPPTDPREHLAFFRCPVEFGQAHTELVLDDATMDLPLRTAQEIFQQMFQREVERALAAMPELRTFAASVRGAVKSALSSGRCTLEATAKSLRTSTRTLQRRLREEGTSFDEILDALRRELARAYLERGLPIPEISTLLGYAEASAFHHAFKRWTGRSPEQTRREHRATG
jgi:AraC-like DNA-binding protein